MSEGAWDALSFLSLLRRGDFDHFETIESDESLWSQPIVLTGTGPLERSALDWTLRSLDCSVISHADASSGIVVVGREDWDQALLQAVVNLRAGQRLRVYSQEAIVAYLATGLDPFDQPDVVLVFREDHAALRFVSELPGFDWPSTNVGIPAGSSVVSVPAPKSGLLAAAGYRVGKSGLASAAARRSILQRLYNSPSSELPFDAVDLTGDRLDEYRDSWGQQRSEVRLKKLANTIASLCRNEKKRTPAPALAIEHREVDLDWLRQAFYVGVYDGGVDWWPTTHVPGVTP